MSKEKYMRQQANHFWHFIRHNLLCELLKKYNSQQRPVQLQCWEIDRESERERKREQEQERERVWEQRQTT